MPDDDQLPKAHTAIIGLYDILGYQSFMENTDDASLETVAARVVKYISVSDRVHKEFLLTKIRDESLEDTEALLNRFHSLIFSDTILTYVPYDPNAPLEVRSWHWAVFMMMSTYFNRGMLDFGLPVRGIISCGRLIHADNTFAGKQLVTANLLYKEMDLAMTAFDESGQMEHDRSRGFNIWDVLEYDVPRKNGTTQHLLALNLVCAVKEHFMLLNGDLTEYFSNRFSMHNKSIAGEDVQRKIRNTVAFYEHLKKIYPQQFT